MFEENSADFKVVNWLVSRSQCVSLGGDLLSIRNRKEQDFIETLLARNIYWIGHSNDLNSRLSYVWSDNSDW